MPKHKDLTPKRERFCREFLVDLNQTAAAKRAGYKHPGVQAAQLMAIPEVRDRVAELQEAVAERNGITIDGVCTELEAIRDGAKASEQWSAASNAEMGRAKVGGLLIERRIDETERSKSDADLAKDAAATAPEKYRAQIEQIITAMLNGNVGPIVAMLDRLNRLGPHAA
jgi:phage terminase small subunit